MGRRKIITVEASHQSIIHKLDIELDEKETELFLHLDESPNLSEFIRRVKNILWRDMGISDFAHSPLNTNCGILDPCGTYDQKYTDRYAREGFHQGDLVVKHLLTSKTPVFRSDISAHIETAPYETDFFQRHREATEYIQKCGLLDVFAIPIVGNDYVASFSVSCHKLNPVLFRERVEKNIAKLRLIAILVDFIGKNRFPASFHPSVNPRVPITQRALELIEIVIKKDCSIGDAAQLMGIELSTANKHLKRAKQALNTDTIQGTCIAAIREKIITLD